MPATTQRRPSRRKGLNPKVRVLLHGHLFKLSPALVPAIARGEARLVTLPGKATVVESQTGQGTAEPALRSNRARPQPPSTKPLKTWAGVAEVLGVSTHTVARHRKARGDKRRPWFPSADAVRDWYAELVAGPAPKKPVRRRTRKTEVDDSEFTLENLIAGKIG